MPILQLLALIYVVKNFTDSYKSANNYQSIKIKVFLPY